MKVVLLIRCHRFRLRIPRHRAFRRGWGVFSGQEGCDGDYAHLEPEPAGILAHFFVCDEDDFVDVLPDEVKVEAALRRGAGG